MKALKTLNTLAELASDGENTYKIVDFAFGFIPYKNDVNMVKEVGNDYDSIGMWLLNEMKKC